MNQKSKTSLVHAKTGPARKRELFPSHEIREGITYYAITLGANENGEAWTDTQTLWIGFADDEGRVEIRKIRPVIAEKFAEFWEDFKQPYCVVNDNAGFVRWQLSGGHALITNEQTSKHIPQELEPRPCVVEGALGFTDIKKLPKTTFQKAPTRKLRMEVLKRDEYRCKICGQRPADDVNIQLHTHHIRPYGKRGITTGKNLICLCHTCHDGLEPHYEYSLFELIETKPKNSGGDLKKQLLTEYITTSQNYRKSILSMLNSSDLRNLGG